ncbi:ankyrin repeat-containing-like protein [Cinnamomum micranthum f. kanehirae]|uniref:Ankyrin repeat-containing-like protein n=1 Tax=Cinnamomum micranthum f. kanehirae TaxID=337451 RepID=A0A443N5V4_9MAGN|nr:ankyrin repeat-containing-like protein [Cinnamomum micranthum f. kanehirae]
MSPEKNMDVQLHKAAREGHMELLTSILEKKHPPDLTFSLTPQKNTALHIAVAFGHEQIVLEMIRRMPSLISQPNSKGDTPLHIAAKAGDLSLTELLTPHLVEQVRWREAGAAALKMKNSGGNSGGYMPIHEALKKGHEVVAVHLLGFAGDIEAADDVSDAGESLLYLTSEAGLYYSVTVMLRRGNFSALGPQGRNPLHIAVIRGIGHVLVETAPHLIKAADDFGKTALHYASTIGYYYDDNIWIRIQILRILMSTEPSLAYKSDNDGNYPLVIATIEAPSEAVEIILGYCPDSAELVDRSGRNALHLAVLNNRVSTLDSLIKRPEFKMLINQPDNGGNTPMHLATQHNYMKIMELLLTCEDLDLATTNKEGLTAMDICGYTTKQRMIHDKLKRRGALPSHQLWREMLLMHPSSPSRVLELVSISSNKEAVINTLSVVTALVATVTFAAAFAVPGGYKNDDHMKRRTEKKKTATEGIGDQQRGSRGRVGESQRGS